jgi:stage V sporulation protein AC
MEAGPRERTAYQRLRRSQAPPMPIARNLVLAFIVGGAICAMGQVFFDFFLTRGLPPEQAGAYTSVVVVFLGALLTGLGLYDRIVQVGGMGGALPVSGFANAVVAPAVEFKREGWVMGVGAKMFVVAGPVIVYGLVASFFVGVVRLLLRAGGRL